MSKADPRRMVWTSRSRDLRARPCFPSPAEGASVSPRGRLLRSVELWRLWELPARSHRPRGLRTSPASASGARLAPARGCHTSRAPRPVVPPARAPRPSHDRGGARSGGNWKGRARPPARTSGPAGERPPEAGRAGPATRPDLPVRGPRPDPEGDPGHRLAEATGATLAEAGRGGRGVGAKHAIAVACGDGGGTRTCESPAQARPRLPGQAGQ